MVYAKHRFKKTTSDCTRTGQSELLRDDTTVIATASSRIRDTAEDALGHGSILLRQITAHYHPGLAMATTRGRKVNFGIDSGKDSYAPIVTQLVWNFEERANKTELVLDSPLLKVMV